MFKRILLHLSLPIGLAVIVAAGLCFSFALRNPALEAKNQRLQDDLARIKSENQALQNEIATLERQNKRLREDPEESLYHARTELGMVRPGEVVYQFEAPKESQVPQR